MGDVQLSSEARDVLTRLVETAKRINPENPIRVRFVWLRDPETDRGRVYATGVANDDGTVRPIEPVPV